MDEKELSWFIIPEDDFRLPPELKCLITQFAWGDVTQITLQHWTDALNAEIERALMWACRDGHMAIAQWAHANRAQWHANGATSLDDAFDRACSRGYLAFAQWARDEGAADLNGAFLRACRNHHLAIAQWLHEEGATNLREALREALRHRNSRGYAHITKWLESKLRK